jgi:amidase
MIRDVQALCCESVRGKCAGGYFARSAELLRRAGDVLLDPATKSGAPLTHALVAKDAFDLADPPTSAAIYQVTHPA